MDEDANKYSANHQSDHFTVALDYSLDKHINPSNSKQSPENGVEMVDYMLGNHPPQPQISLDKLSFADVMQFSDFGPKLALRQSKIPVDDDESNYFLRQHEELMEPPLPRFSQEKQVDTEQEEQLEKEDIMLLESNAKTSNPSVEFPYADKKVGKGLAVETKNRRKRMKLLKTSEEVESQRMTHIEVERNRRRQMNDHLRVLRSLMPGSYVQRGDQASIVGGAIEFVRELEQLLQCLESQKKRRLFGGNELPTAMTTDPSTLPTHLPFFSSLPEGMNDHQMRILDIDPCGLIEEMAENKSCLADIEVRLLGIEAMIKILCTRKPGQLVKIITDLEELKFNILQTNVTTIEKTVLYSFVVEITAETRYSAEDIANSVQQILSFINSSPL